MTIKVTVKAEAGVFTPPRGVEINGSDFGIAGVRGPAALDKGASVVLHPGGEVDLTIWSSSRVEIREREIAAPAAEAAPTPEPPDQGGYGTF